MRFVTAICFVLFAACRVPLASSVIHLIDISFLFQDWPGPRTSGSCLAEYGGSHDAFMCLPSPLPSSPPCASFTLHHCVQTLAFYLFVSAATLPRLFLCHNPVMVIIMFLFEGLSRRCPMT
jgi:hypothetical protein